MDAVKYIEDNLNPIRVLEYYDFKNITEADDSIRACCKIHNGNNPTGFVWNKLNNLWFCYTGDCHGGDVFNLIQKIENINFNTSVQKAAYILDLDIEGMEIVIPDNVLQREQRRWLETQRKKNQQTNTITEYELPYTKYTDVCTEFTRFDEDTVSYYNAKFCTLYPTEKGFLKNKLVIPIKDENELLLGVALRDLTGKAIPKWYYQPDGIKVSKLLYNLPSIKKQTPLINTNKPEEIILVEGIFDVWAYHRIGIDNACAVFGSSISKEQYKIILSTGLPIVLSFDNDAAGQKCTKQAIELFNNKTAITIVTLPENKDPADCSKDELLAAYLNRASAQR